MKSKLLFKASSICSGLIPICNKISNSPKPTLRSFSTVIFVVVTGAGFWSALKTVFLSSLSLISVISRLSELLLQGTNLMAEKYVDLPVLHINNNYLILWQKWLLSVGFGLFLRSKITQQKVLYEDLIIRTSKEKPFEEIEYSQYSAIRFPMEKDSCFSRPDAWTTLNRCYNKTVVGESAPNDF